MYGSYLFDDLCLLTWNEKKFRSLFFLVEFNSIFRDFHNQNLYQFGPKKDLSKKNLFCHLVTETSLKTKFCLLRGTMQDIIFALWYILTRKNIDSDTKGTGNDDIISEPISPKNPR